MRHPLSVLMISPLFQGKFACSFQLLTNRTPFPRFFDIIIVHLEFELLSVLRSCCTKIFSWPCRHLIYNIAAKKEQKSQGTNVNTMLLSLGLTSQFGSGYIVLALTLNLRTKEVCYKDSQYLLNMYSVNVEIGCTDGCLTYTHGL